MRENRIEIKRERKKDFIEKFHVAASFVQAHTLTYSHSSALSFVDVLVSALNTRYNVTNRNVVNR